MPSNPNLPAAPAACRLRIAHVILSRGFAGSERSTAESCNAQCSEHEVLLVVRRDCRSAAGACIRDHLDSRVTVAEVPGRWLTRRRLAQILREWRPDVVHAHLRRATRFLAQVDPPAAQVATLHLGVNGRHFLQMDGLVCISSWQVATIPSTFRGRVFSIPNSLVPHPRLPAERIAELRAELGAGPATYLVGGVGRLAASKGFDLLIRAFEQARLPQARLVIIGEGRERARLEKLAGEEACFVGFRPNVKDYYQALDLFVCPSRREPMGRVILEALDAGTPVVATAVAGPKEILAQYPGELVPTESVAELAQALSRHHARGRVRVEVDLREHHLERVAGQLIAAYRQVIEDRAAAQAAEQADAGEPAVRSRSSQTTSVVNVPSGRNSNVR